jgi:hypothetical protein
MASVSTLLAFFSLMGNTFAEEGSETFVALVPLTGTALVEGDETFVVFEFTGATETFLFDNAVVEQAPPMVFFGAEIGLLSPPGAFFDGIIALPTGFGTVALGLATVLFDEGTTIAIMR